MAVVETVPGRQPVADINEKDAIQDNAIESDSASDHKQQGVKNAEAVTIAWDRKMLILTFVL